MTAGTEACVSYVSSAHRLPPSAVAEKRSARSFRSATLPGLASTHAIGIALTPVLTSLNRRFRFGRPRSSACGSRRSP